MARVRNPITLAKHLGIDSEELASLGVTNITLAVDTHLFIDPLLLSQCANHAFAASATKQYETYFTQLIKLLAACRSIGDVAWRSAWGRLHFRELRGTCLGYGAGSIDGSAWGKDLVTRVLATAREIVNLGITDPDIFPLLGLLEKNVGPDRISDMATNVVIEALLDFNSEALAALGQKGEPFRLLGRSASLLRNPYHQKRTPIILVPKDILRPLPIAYDWSSVACAAAHNSRLRERVNKHIGELWEGGTKGKKNKLRAEALSSKEAMETLLTAVKGVDRRGYDVALDKDGLLRWAEIGRQAAENYPLRIPKPKTPDLDAAHKIVAAIIGQFRQLVENNGLAKSLWSGKKRLPESYAQRLFFAVAYSYSKVNNLDLSPEVDSGNGRIDFKFSYGFEGRVLVELKLSTNSKLIDGYLKQLEAYRIAEETTRAFYLVIDVGKLGKKDEKLTKIRNDVSGKGHPASILEFVDGHVRPSGSKR
jgi:hypothetical protein